MTEPAQVTWPNSIEETSEMTKKWLGLQMLKIKFDQKLLAHIHCKHDYDKVGRKYLLSNVVDIIEYYFMLCLVQWFLIKYVILIVHLVRVIQQPTRVLVVENA